MAPNSSVACEPIPEPGDEEVTDFACLSRPYFRFTYNYEHSEKNKRKLTNWLDKVLPVAYERKRFRDHEIIIHNGTIIEDVIDSILMNYPIRRLRTIVGLGGSYMITVNSDLHELAWGVGDLVVHPVVYGAIQGSSLEGASERKPSSIARALMINVGPGGNMLYCDHVDKLHDIVKEVTGYSSTIVVNKQQDRNMFGKCPDISYYPRYLPILRQMQGMNPFPTFLGEVHYTDSAIKGIFDYALQIDGSNFQPEYVLGMDIKVDKRTTNLREVHLSAYDCTLEEMLRLSRNDDLDKEQRAAVLQTALLKAQRAHNDIQCLIDLLINPPQTVKEVQNLASQFHYKALEYWQGTLGSFTYKIFEADEDFQYLISYLVKTYSVIPTLRDDLNANRSYYEEQIKNIQQDLTKLGNIEVDRAPLTTKAILANRVTFVIRRYYRELSVEKFVAGHKVDDTQWHFPIQAIMGVITAHARTGIRTTLDQGDLKEVYSKMRRIINVPCAIGPLQIRQEMILPALFGDFACQRYLGHTERTARKKLLQEFERNNDVIDVKKIDLKYLTDDALSTISGEDTLDSDADVYRSARELLAEGYFAVEDASTGANASSSRSKARRGRSSGTRGHRSPDGKRPKR